MQRIVFFQSDVDFEMTTHLVLERVVGDVERFERAEAHHRVRQVGDLVVGIIKDNNVHTSGLWLCAQDE